MHAVRLLPLATLVACAARAPAPASAHAPVAPVLVAATPRPAADGVTELADLVHGERRTPVAWHPLAREGVSYGDGPPFGALIDANGETFAAEKDRETCFYPDYNGVLQAHGATWMLTHFECAPAALYVSRLERAAAGWEVVDSRPAPHPTEGPLNQLCSGDVTAWGTLLSGEEYETDMSPVPDSGREDYSWYEGWIRQVADAPPPSGYANGWMVETEVLDAAGVTASTRRLAMGRFSHELGLVMPDDRTVYLTDDGGWGMFSRFVADRPGDMSSGRLYAARLDWEGQLGAGEPVGLSWIDLGHADEATLRAALPTVRYDALFDQRPLTDAGCEEGFTAYRNPHGEDACLQVREGQEVLASRFETRRFAATRGATVELEKAEGLAFDPVGHRLYLALTRFARGALADDPSADDHVRLPAQGCGAVLAFDLPADGADAWSAGAGRVELAGVGEDEESCALPGISGPDNLTWADGLGVLLIAEDTDRAPNRLWAWDGAELLPILAAPPRPAEGRMSEVSGLSWVELDGQGWATISLQHPGGQPAAVGLVGPFPASSP
jgi:secreted PhoX family phosphatase